MLGRIEQPEILWRNSTDSIESVYGSNDLALKNILKSRLTHQPVNKQYEKEQRVQRLSRKGLRFEDQPQTLLEVL